MSLESLLMQTIVRCIFAQRTNVPSEIINAYESTGENIFKLRQIIHCVEGINNATEPVTWLLCIRVLISAAEYNTLRSLNATLTLLLGRKGPIWQMSCDKGQLFRANGH